MWYWCHVANTSPNDTNKQITTKKKTQQKRKLLASKVINVSPFPFSLWVKDSFRSGRSNPQPIQLKYNGTKRRRVGFQRKKPGFLGSTCYYFLSIWSSLEFNQRPSWSPGPSLQLDSEGATSSRALWTPAAQHTPRALAAAVVISPGTEEKPGVRSFQWHPRFPYQIANSLMTESSSVCFHVSENSTICSTNEQSQYIIQS